MSVRSIATAGAAFAAAGAVTVATVIAPPLQPRDIEIVKRTEVDLAAQLTLPDLVNVFFGVTPQGAYKTNPANPPYLPPVDTDTAGTFGASGVIYQLLANQVGADEDARGGVDAFFTGGFTGLLQAYLEANGADPLVQAFANGGFPLVVQLVLLTAFPGEADTINTFFSDGVPGLTHALLNQIGPAETDQLVNIFFNIDNPLDDENPSQYGVSGVTYALLTQSGLLQPDQQFVVNSFFSGGATGVVRDQLLVRFTDPQQQAVINAYFSGGVAGLAQQQLDTHITDPVANDLINEFFDNGVAGVVRYLLVGAAPEGTLPDDPFDPTPAAKQAPPSLFSVERTAAAADPNVEPGEEDSLGDQDAGSVVNFSAPADPAPADPAPADPAPADPAPAAAPTGDPQPQPGFTARVRELSVAEEKAAEEGESETTPEEPVLIYGTGGPKPGTGWDAWGKKLNDFGTAINNIVNPPKPAPADPAPSADPGEAGGEGGEG